MTRFTRPDNWPNEWPSQWPNEWQNLLAGYALGDLDSEEIQALQELLAEQPELIAEVNRLQETLALMPYALPEQDPPPHLRATILAAAAAERPTQAAVQSSGLEARAPETSGARSRRHPSRWLAGAGAIAAVALLGLGFDNLRLRQQVAASQADREQAMQQMAELRQELANQEAILATLQSSDARLYALEGDSQATGSIVLNRRQNQVVVVAQNLPQLPDGQAYRLWAMPQNSQQPAYCGQFNSSPSGSVSQLWQAPKPVCSANPAQLLITAESATAPPVPQGELVMKSRV